VPNPKILIILLQKYKSESNPENKAKVALQLAAVFDEALKKDKSFTIVESAISILKGQKALKDPEMSKILRNIVRNHLAIFEEKTGAWLKSLEKKYPGSPLLNVMIDEFNAYRHREAERLSRYLFQ
jgi:hypothetical protein